MSYRAPDLQPGSLYITISIPETTLSPPRSYLPYLPSDFDPDAYETSCPGIGREEFRWGIYWHRGPGDGTWYTIRRETPWPTPALAPYVAAACLKYGVDPRGLLPKPPAYVLDTQTLTHQSPRLDRSVVALIRVLHAPASLSRDLSAYLDWLTTHISHGARRSFIWATTVYLRARNHVSGHRGLGGGPQQPAAFDVERFLWEALELAYGEVYFALGGQLPRPVLVSQFGVLVRAVEDEEKQGAQLGMGAEEDVVGRKSRVHEMLLRKLNMDSSEVSPRSRPRSRLESRCALH